MCRVHYLQCFCQCTCEVAVCGLLQLQYLTVLDIVNNLLLYVEPSHKVQTMADVSQCYEIHCRDYV